MQKNKCVVIVLFWGQPAAAAAVPNELSMDVVLGRVLVFVSLKMDSITRCPCTVVREDVKLEQKLTLGAIGQSVS